MASFLFEPFHLVCDYLSTVSGFEVDKVRYFVLWGLSIPLAFVMHYALPPSKVGTLVRHCYATSLGVLMGVLCFGWAVCVLFAAVLVGYLLLLVVSPREVHKVTMVYILGVIGAAHVYRMITDYRGYHLDFTGPLMIIVQKISLAAFSICDGQSKEKDLNKDQRKNQLKSVPPILDYFSYCFNFLQFLAGPTCTLKEYQMFIDGSNFAIDNPNRFARADLHSKAPSTILPWLQPFIYSAMLFFGFVYLTSLFPPEDYVTHTLYDTSTEEGNSQLLKQYVKYIFDPKNTVIQTALLLFPCFFAQRCKYYFTWKLNESINNASGMGFSGYDKQDGTPQWDLAVNCVPFWFEFGSSPKIAIENWNMTTAAWLRRVCYERVSFQPIMMVFILSAYWHGFYPGYYTCFVMLAIMVQAARKARRVFRPYFLENKRIKLFYDVVTTLATAFYIPGLACTFIFMEWSDILACHTQYYCLHDIALVVFLLLPIKAPRSKKEEHKKEKSEGDAVRGGVEGDSHTLKSHEKTVDGAEVAGQDNSIKQD